MTDHDPVNSPSHYASGGVECIDAIEAALTPEEARGFRKGNAMKYIWRAGKKGNYVEDLKKAAWYLDREIFETEYVPEETIAYIAERARAEFVAGQKRAEAANEVREASLLADELDDLLPDSLDAGGCVTVGCCNEAATDRPHHSPDHLDRPSPCPPPLRGASSY